ILNAMNETTNITITNYDGTIIYVNNNFCLLSKFKKKEIIGQNHRVVNSGFHSKEFFMQLWQTIKSGILGVVKFKIEPRMALFSGCLKSLCQFLMNKDSRIISLVSKRILLKINRWKPSLN